MKNSDPIAGIKIAQNLVLEVSVKNAEKSQNFLNCFELRLIRFKHDFQSHFPLSSALFQLNISTLHEVSKSGVHFVAELL